MPEIRFPDCDVSDKKYACGVKRLTCTGCGDNVCEVHSGSLPDGRTMCEDCAAERAFRMAADIRTGLGILPGDYRDVLQAALTEYATNPQRAQRDPTQLEQAEITRRVWAAQDMLRILGEDQD